MLPFLMEFPKKCSIVHYRFKPFCSNHHRTVGSNHSQQFRPFGMATPNHRLVFLSLSSTPTKTIHFSYTFTIKQWSINRLRRTRLRTLKEARAPTPALASFSPDGTRLLAAHPQRSLAAALRRAPVPRKAHYVRMGPRPTQSVAALTGHTGRMSARHTLAARMFGCYCRHYTPLLPCATLVLR